MLIAAARARRRSLCGPSCRFWSWVYACTVVIRPLTMPKLSRSTLAIGATQFVVQEALEMIVCASGSYLSSLTPITIVMSSSLAGAEMMTFFAPASMCARALGPAVNSPVDSITTSTPRSPHGSLAGSRSARILIDRSPTVMVSPDTDTSCGSVPTTLSYLSRCAMVATSPRSFAATISMPRSPSAALAARQKLRPIRPKPLIPTRIVTVLNLLVDPLIASGSETIGRRPADGADSYGLDHISRENFSADLSIRASRTRIRHGRAEGTGPSVASRGTKGMTRMKQYLLSIYQPDGDSPPPEVLEPIMRDIDAVDRELRAAGAWVFTGGLHAPDTATVLRASDGDVLVTDGPYPEGKEHVGGFWIIQAADLDEALAWARKATVACTLPVEVRPMVDMTES